MSDHQNPRESAGPAKASARPGSDTELDDFICFAVYESNLAFNNLYRSLLGDLGLTYPQYLVMTLLWRRDRRTVREIGDALSLEYNTLTPMIKRLEALGLVSRVRDEQDQRVVNVTLTTEGTALQEKARKIPQCIAEATGLSVPELKDLKARLDTLRSNLRSGGGQE
ncbi:MarR family winged helix-turn-helix transcriptional regulator [Roseibium marinum]|uniref:DNA-binding MarR family transcriptional regulator n=1 Tax=Roseibium marinum TaxID=281252 RepID=A0A2S3UK88_9HYPH|nr:MarR family transcriptional regulator [Roseibium marinum]POF28075.1 DNA-binding MarR family transcriptional regulator [Roseibium marinum]